MATAMDTAMDELQHPPSPRHLADMYTSQNGTVVRSLGRPDLKLHSYCQTVNQQHLYR